MPPCLSIRNRLAAMGAGVVVRAMLGGAAASAELPSAVVA